MCGICGIVALDRPPESDVARAMLAELRHRGPDGDGSFSAPGVALAHARLAIVDLSDAGRQPFASDDGSLQLLHNGEVFNYVELRGELEKLGHGFRSHTDTEVILRAYQEWGEECVERFNGMWAFALWDGRRQRLFCSRDRFGIKPLYYRCVGSRFVFASEPRAFRHDPATSLAPNLAAVRDFLEQGYSDHRPGQSFFAGVEQLPAAHSLTFDRAGITVRRYWRLEPQLAAEDASERFRELFVDSVRLRLRSDVPLGTALSGGLDSSAVAVTVDHLLRTEADSARRVGSRQQTFTAYFSEDGYDERPFAEAVAARILSEPHLLTFDAEQLLDVLPEVVEAQGEPFGSTSIVAQWFVMRAARDAGLKVMLDGQGGDEVLAGYASVAWAYRLAGLLASGRVATARREARSASLSGRRLAEAVAVPFLPYRARWWLRGRRRRADLLAHPRLRQIPTPPAPERIELPDRLRTQYHAILSRFGLPELLRYEDRNTMTHSLEGRVPFLDHRLVELAYGLPAESLLGGGVTKIVLRQALGDLLPAPVRDRHDKLGFVTPERAFMRGALGRFAREVLSSPRTRARALVDTGEALRRLDGDVASPAEPWRALSVELWARAFLD